MKTNRTPIREEPAALDVAEEAVHLLRTAPAHVIAAYYVGSIPFILGLLYLWADMSRSAFAGRHCAPAALGLALLFVWMKIWQTIFAVGLKGSLTREPAPPWTPATSANSPPMRV